MRETPISSVRGRVPGNLRSLIVLALVVASLACIDGGPRPSPAMREVPACDAPPQPPPTQWTGEAPGRARIYVDGSGSMHGYLGHGDVYSKVLDRLRPVLLSCGVGRSPGSTTVQMVGRDLQPLSHSGDFRYLDERNQYQHGETNLAAVLEAELVLQEDADVTPAIALLVTDGVMSLRHSQAQAGSLADCDQGSDIYCLVYKIVRLVGRGKGLWIVGLRTRFSGTLYSEKLQIGGKAIGTADLPDRPFYLWVLAENAPAARRFIAGLLDGIGLQPDGAAAFVIEVAPGTIPWSLPSPGEPPAPSRRLLPGVEIGAVTGEYRPGYEGTTPSLPVVSQGLSGSAFGLHLPLQRTELAQAPLWCRAFTRYEASYCLRWQPDGPLAAVQTFLEEDPTGLYLGLLATDFRELAGKRATLVQRLSRSPAGSGSDPMAMVGEWSTRDDSTVENAARTFNLEELLDLLRSQVELAEGYEQPLLTLELE